MLYRGARRVGRSTGRPMDRRRRRGLRLKIFVVRCRDCLWFTPTEYPYGWCRIKKHHVDGRTPHLVACPLWEPVHDLSGEDLDEPERRELI